MIPLFEYTSPIQKANSFFKSCNKCETHLTVHYCLPTAYCILPSAFLNPVRYETYSPSALLNNNWYICLDILSILCPPGPPTWREVSVGSGTRQAHKNYKREHMLFNKALVLTWFERQEKLLTQQEKELRSITFCGLSHPQTSLRMLPKAWDIPIWLSNFCLQSQFSTNFCNLIKFWHLAQIRNLIESLVSPKLASCNPNYVQIEKVADRILLSHNHLQKNHARIKLGTLFVW